jgi:hypothetical protein
LKFIYKVRDHKRQTKIYFGLYHLLHSGVMLLGLPKYTAEGTGKISLPKQMNNTYTTYKKKMTI